MFRSMIACETLDCRKCGRLRENGGYWGYQKSKELDCKHLYAVEVVKVDSQENVTSCVVLDVLPSQWGEEDCCIQGKG